METGLDQALARTGDGAFAVGADGRILLWNRAAEKILGYGVRDVMGRSCCEVLRGYDDDGNRLCYQGCHVSTLVKLGDPVQSFDMRTQTKAGQPAWINLSTLTVPGRNGSENGALTVHVFRDVTVTKELLRMVSERLNQPVLANSEPTESAGTLTRREVEVLRLLAGGANTKMAAERLHVSRATVRNHVQNIFGKIGAHSRLEAVAYAHRHRLL